MYQSLKLCRKQKVKLHNNTNFITARVLPPLTEIFMHLLRFGCTGSSLLLGLSLVAVSRGYTVAVVVVCRLLVVAALGADQDSRHTGVSSCVMWA